ncbi:unnamed protein product [Larinioides sclopetarius]|uniref:Uncharacterized protein n=1 Tax=Larinioides sclopetarius TaxID=280406 RepID=A0AAV1ZSH3_9ARAC
MFVNFATNVFATDLRICNIFVLTLMKSLMSVMCAIKVFANSPRLLDILEFILV